MTSYTEATETASTGEGKRNRKIQALSALLSATALGVFLEGCASPAPVISCERSGDDLCFINANGFNDFSFARVVDSPDNVIITVGDVSETIADFANNVYTLYYGSGKTELGKLYVGTENGDRPPRGDDGANVMIGLGGNDILDGGKGDDILYGGVGVDKLYGNDGNDYLYGGAGVDTLYGNDGNDFLYGGAGEDKLYGVAGNDYLDGGANDDTYVFHVGGGTDSIRDVAGDTMTLVFEGGSYEADDFTATGVFVRDGNNLVITIDKDLDDDGITNKITIYDAYDTNPETGTGNAAFTIHIGYNVAAAPTPVVDIWSAL